LARLRWETAGRTLPDRAVAVLADPVFEADDPRLRERRRADAAGAGQSVRTPNKAGSGTGPSRAAPAPGDLGEGGAGPPRLASTKQEADAIVAAAPPGMALTRMGFQASRSMAMSPELAEYRIVHFATHGVFDNENPGLSGVMLSMFDEQGRAQDGFLRLNDIYGLHLPAELVVLSACNTALGRNVKGEGLVGIVRGFMYAGAKRVVASLWKVDDEATGALMERFYAGMLSEQLSPAAALRRAQLSLSRQDQWRAPYYWAGFVLQGEWR
jgi:CHAT domain-containing protein